MFFNVARVNVEKHAMGRPGYEATCNVSSFAWSLISLPCEFITVCVAIIHVQL